MAIETIKKLIPIGGSYGVTLPRNYVHAVGLKPNDLVVCRLTNGRIELIPYGGNTQCQKTT